MIKEERRKKRRAKKLKIALLIALFVILILVLVIWKGFVVKDVKVEGNVLYDEVLIKETVLNDEYSWNSLYVLLKYTFVDAEELPFIDTMEVKMNHPQSLTITVYEKGMLGYMYVSGLAENVYFDKDGFVVETSKRVIDNVPRIDGIICEEIILYEQLPIDDQLLRQMLTLTQSLKREGLEPDSINYSVENEPILYYNKVAVRLGTMENLTLKVEHLSKILPAIMDMSGVLHMESWTEESKNIIFEQSPKIEDASSETEENVSQSEEDVSQSQESISQPEQESGE